MESVRLNWELHTPVDLETAWRTFANTDRFNRACGLGFQFEELAQPDGTVRRVGEARKFGLRLRWEELPFHIVAPSGFVSLRRFDGGPLRTLRTTLSMTEAPDGTAIVYTVDLEPRSFLLRPLVAADAALTTQPMLDRTLHRVLDSLRGLDPLDPPPPLSDEAEAQLQAFEGDDPVRAAITRRIRDAPLDVQDRLKPLEIADELGCQEEVAIGAFLDGVTEGVLELRWELLCPSCRGAKATAPRLGEGPEQVHCTSCNIRYDTTFPDRVTVVFRPTPRIRRFEVPIDCLLSPSRTPHVLGQGSVQPGGEIEWSLELPAGGYHIDSRPAVGGAVLEVREGLPDLDLALDLTDDGLRPRVLRLAPGPRRIRIRNRTGRPTLLGLEQRWMPPFTLTAGRLLEETSGAAILPAEAVAPGLDTSIGAGVVVAACTLSGDGDPDGPLHDELVALVRRATLSVRTGREVVGVFDTLGDALAVVRNLSRATEVSAGIAWGSVVSIQRDDERTPTGSTVERALAVMRAIGGSRVAVHASHKDDPELDRALTAAALQARDPGAYCHLQVRRDPESQPQRRRQREVDPPPSVCGRFEVQEELGRGAHGQVFAARDTRTGHSAVVKLLLPEIASDPDAVQRFYAEARFTARIDHPHVVRVLDWGHTRDERLYLALERLGGRTLLRRLESSGPLSVADVLTLAYQTLDALEVTHAARVLHRDLKPANLFLMEGERLFVKVLDFGVAQQLGTDDPAVEAGHLLGTPEYMSPEQVDGDPLDARSDLYGLGVVLYEALCGQLPFEGDRSYIVAMQRLLEDPIPLRQRDPSLPEEVETWLMRALALDPPLRWPSAEAMRRALPRVGRS